MPVTALILAESFYFVVLNVYERIVEKRVRDILDKQLEESQINFSK